MTLAEGAGLVAIALAPALHSRRMIEFFALIQNPLYVPLPEKRGGGWGVGFIAAKVQRSRPATSPASGCLRKYQLQISNYI